MLVHGKPCSLVLLSAFVLGATSGSAVSATGGVGVSSEVIGQDGFATKPDADGTINQNEIKNDNNSDDCNNSHPGTGFANDGKNENKKLIPKGGKNIKGGEGNLVYTQGSDKSKVNSAKGKLSGSTFRNLAVTGGTATFVSSAAAVSKKVFDYINKKENSQISKKEDENNNKNNKQNTGQNDDNQETKEIKSDDDKSANKAKEWIKKNPVLFSMLVFMFLFIIGFVVCYFVRSKKSKSEYEDLEKESEINKRLNNIPYGSEDKDLNYEELENGPKINKLLDNNPDEFEDKELSEKLSKFETEVYPGALSFVYIKNYRKLFKLINIGNTETLTLECIVDNDPFADCYRNFLKMASSFYDTKKGFWYACEEKDIIEVDKGTKEIGNKIEIKFMSMNDYLTKMRKQKEKIFDPNYSDLVNNKRRVFANFGYRNLEDVKQIYFFSLFDGSFLDQAFDDRDKEEMEKCISFIKDTADDLINKEEYGLSDDNKTFLKNMYNALMLYGQLVEYALKSGFKDREGQIKKQKNRNGIINDFNFYLWVLDWCISNIKNKSEVLTIEKNEKILFLAKVVASEAAVLSSNKNREVQNKLVTILNIYEGKAAEKNNGELQNIISFKDIQFMDLALK